MATPNDILCGMFNVITLDQVSKNEFMSACFSLRQANIELLLDLFIANPTHERFMRILPEQRSEIEKAAIEHAKTQIVELSKD